MPEVDDSGIIDVKDGRHPVIEKMLPSGAFVANDTYLDKDSNRVSIITGPNMAVFNSSISGLYPIFMIPPSVINIGGSSTIALSIN